MGVQLGPEMMSYAVATIAPDGKVLTDCVTGEKAAARSIAATPGKAPQDVHR